MCGRTSKKPQQEARDWGSFMASSFLLFLPVFVVFFTLSLFLHSRWFYFRKGLPSWSSDFRLFNVFFYAISFLFSFSSNTSKGKKIKKVAVDVVLFWPMHLAVAEWLTSLVPPLPISLYIRLGIQYALPFPLPLLYCSFLLSIFGCLPRLLRRQPLLQNHIEGDSVV